VNSGSSFFAKAENFDFLHKMIVRSSGFERQKNTHNLWKLLLEPRFKMENVLDVLNAFNCYNAVGLFMETLRKAARVTAYMQKHSADQHRSATTQCILEQICRNQCIFAHNSKD
jgi:hypothetical protein